MGQDQMSFARQALDRNEHLQVVASDSQARTFTVRLKDSGRLVVIPVDQIVAGPAGAMPATTAQTAAGPSVGGSVTRPSTPAVAEPLQPEAAASVASSRPGAAERASSQAGGNSSSDLSSGGSSALASGSTDEATSPADAVNESHALHERGASANGDLRQSEKGPHAQSATNATAGSVLAAGPGYSIKASGPEGGPARQSPVTAARGTPERLHDPIVCQGARLLHIDNRNLEFDGDAITAEDGCEIHITNTHITAKGIGVLARAANVHIKNSEIDGDSGAVDASDGAQVYAESSRFKGLTRRLESSAFHDLGGNVWN